MQLLEHFKELTLHPKNAEELKGLILQLAVQGKLTKQWRMENVDVEPASVLIKKLEEEKKQLIQGKQIRKEKPLDPIDSNDIIPNIPHTWEMIKLGEIGDWGAGATPLRSRSDFYDGNINWFKSGELNNGIIDYNSEETINELAIKNSSLRLNKIGDVLIAMYGATIGKTAILAVEGTTNQAVCACTPFSCITNVYLHLLLKALKGKFINQGEGGAQPNISRVKIRNQVFALPPLEEQKAIVAIVNQLFAEVEQLEDMTKERIQLKSDFVTSALNQLTQAAEQDTASQWEFLQQHFGTFFTEKENIKKLREGILQLAVQGKLTRDWRALRQTQGIPIEHASTLLEKIKAEKEQLIKEKKIKKEKPLPEISEEEMPYELPEGWVWCRLGDMSQFLNGDRGKNYPNKDEYVEEGVAWINTGHINPDGTLSKLRMNFITRQKFNSLRSGKIQDGDLVYCLRGATFGKTAFVTPYSEGAVASSLMIIRNYLQETSDYTYRFLISPEGKRQLLRFDNGSAQPNLSANKVKLYLLPLASLEEQKAIVDKVNSLMALCDKLEQEIENHQTTQEEWMQSCLREVMESN